MNYTLMPSLEHIALVKISTALWNQDNIRALIAKFDFQLLRSERIEKWQEIEDKVVEKVPHLQQPEPLKEEILGLIKPIGLQILKWIEYHEENCYLSIDLPNEFCWTPQGTVDKKKTAEILIKDESLDITDRYKLACIYCLEDDVPELWNKVPDSCRSFYNEEDPCARNVVQHELVVLWTYDIEGEVAIMNNRIERKWRSKCSLYQYAFEYAAVSGNKAATEYFLQKLTSVEREKSLVRFAGYLGNKSCYTARSHHKTRLPQENAEVLCFLLSQMDEEQQVEVFKSIPLKVLICLLDWPCQSLFMQTANRMWDFLTEDYYCDTFLSIIVKKVVYGYKDCNYRKLFGEFWKQSPHAYKRYVIGFLIKYPGFWFSDLFEIEDNENIKLILKDATVIEKEKIIFNSKVMNICENLIFNDKWDLLNLFIQECISSKDIMVKFKEKFEEHIMHWYSEAQLHEEKDTWNKFFQLLDNLTQENNKKRNIEEGQSSPAKRLRSIDFEEGAT